MSALHVRLLWSCVSAVLVLASGARGDAAACEDTDTGACALFLKQKSDLCVDPILSPLCRRFCGLCPLVCYSCLSPLSNPQDCVNTTSCGPNEKCIRMEHRAPSGQLEHIMSCETNQVCEGVGFGFPQVVGRRSASEGEGRLYSRDVALKCCDVDLCNKPPVTTTPNPTTTAPPTTTAKPTTTRPTTTTKPTTTPAPTTHVPTTLLPATTKLPMLPVNACKSDLVFVVDGSSTVGKTNHLSLVDFLLQVTKRLRVGPRDTQVAVVEFGNYASVEWQLNTHPDLQSLTTAMARLPYTGGNTATEAALWLVRNSVFTAAHGDRPASPDVVVLVTDGGTNLPDLLQIEAQALHGTGVKVVAIGVGASADRSELATLASTTGEYFLLPTYQTLTFIVSRIQEILCHH